MTLASILIKCNDQYSYLEDSLPIITNQTVKDTEAILIYSGRDESKSQRTLSLARSWGLRILHFDRSPFSAPAAINYGARVAQGQYLVCLSADAVPRDDHWLESLLHHFWCPCVAGVYGRHTLRPHYSWWERLRVGYWLDRWRIAQRYRDQAMCKWRVDDHLFSNAMSAIRRELWERHKFDESLASGCEDYEWARWAHAKGYTVVYEPEASASHTHGESYRFLSYLVRAVRFKVIRSRIDARPQPDLPCSDTSSPCPSGREHLDSAAKCPLRLARDQAWSHESSVGSS